MDVQVIERDIIRTLDVTGDALPEMQLPREINEGLESKCEETGERPYPEEDGISAGMEDNPEALSAQDGDTVLSEGTAPPPDDPQLDSEAGDGQEIATDGVVHEMEQLNLADTSDVGSDAQMANTADTTVLEVSGDDQPLEAPSEEQKLEDDPSIETINNAPLTRRDFAKFEEIEYTVIPRTVESDDPVVENSVSNEELVENEQKEDETPEAVPAVDSLSNSAPSDSIQEKEADDLLQEVVINKPDPKDRKLLKRHRFSEGEFNFDPFLRQEATKGTENKSELSTQEDSSEMTNLTPTNQEKRKEPKLREPKKRSGPKLETAQRRPWRGCSVCSESMRKAQRVYGSRISSLKPLQIKPRSKPTQESGTGKDGRKQQKQYFQEELNRLRNSLQRESSKIKAPTKKPFTPNTFNSLKPYYNTATAAYLIELPDEVRHAYSIRPTALGLTDPWDDYSMDRALLPPIHNRMVKQPTDAKKKKKKKPSKSHPCGGSTHLPDFPHVLYPTGDLTTRSLYYSDVPMLRKELKRLYSDSAEDKVGSEYTRTVNDFFRMGLHRMQDYHPINRPHMRACYFAYFQNNKGAKKAVYKCVHEVDKEEKEVEQEEEAEEQPLNPPAQSELEAAA